MSLRHRIAGWFVTPVDMQFTVPPADIVPGFQLPAALPANAEAEYAARIDVALRLIAGVLEDESHKPTGTRNVARFDLALEVRSALRPSASGSEVLREVPSVGIRYASVPVVPGRSS